MGSKKNIKNRKIKNSGTRERVGIEMINKIDFLVAV